VELQLVVPGALYGHDPPALANMTPHRMTVVACIIGPSSSIVAALRSAASRSAGLEGKRDEGASTNSDRSNTTQQSDGRPEAGKKRWARRLRDADAAATAAVAAGTGGMPAPATSTAADAMRVAQECVCVCVCVSCLGPLVG